MDESKGRAKGRAIGGCIGALEDPGVEQRSDGIKVSDVMADEGNVEYKKFAALHAGVTLTGRLSMHVHVMATTAAEKALGTAAAEGACVASVTFLHIHSLLLRCIMHYHIINYQDVVFQFLISYIYLIIILQLIIIQQLRILRKRTSKQLLYA